MQALKNYMNRIDDILSEDTPSKRKKGFAGEAKDTSATKVEEQEIRAIAKIVKGIREAREEYVNGRANKSK